MTRGVLVLALLPALAAAEPAEVVLDRLAGAGDPAELLAAGRRLGPVPVVAALDSVSRRVRGAAAIAVLGLDEPDLLPLLVGRAHRTQREVALPAARAAARLAARLGDRLGDLDADDDVVAAASRGCLALALDDERLVEIRALALDCGASLAGDADVDAALLALLRSDEPELRRAAVLRAHGRPPVVAAVVALLAAEADDDVAESAAAVLCQAGALPPLQQGRAAGLTRRPRADPGFARAIRPCTKPPIP